VLCCGFSDDAASHLSLGPAVFPRTIRRSEADPRAEPTSENHRPGARREPR
jgi:hypothetical protein